jgi:ribonuclease PH
MGRHDGRRDDALRPVTIKCDVLEQPFASVMIEMGRTKVLCCASVEERVPGFLVGQREGWVTAEYGMLPASTGQRMRREIDRGRASGRTMEIQRLIGRALRSVVRRRVLGERTIWIDCDVLQADGGTRTASITGAFVAMALALDRMKSKGTIKGAPLQGGLAAVSVGVVEGNPVLDLDYVEDSAAEVDMNIVRTHEGRFVELQGTAESTPFDRAAHDRMLDLADLGIDALAKAQILALSEPLLNDLLGG